MVLHNFCGNKINGADLTFCTAMNLETHLIAFFCGVGGGLS